MSTRLRDVSDAERDSFTPAMWRLIWVSVTGVFLDGYDISVIGLALLQVKTVFHASALQVGLVGSSILVGNFIGALVFGRLGDVIGRRTMFLANVVFFVVFAVLSGLSTSITQLIVWRFLLGIGIGGDYALASPILAEALPANRRGRILTVNWGLAWLCGEILSFAVGYVLLRTAGPDAWRWMLASGALPALVVFALRRKMPESARWLLAKGRHEEAHDVAHALTGKRDIRALVPHVDTPKSSHNPNTSAWRTLWTQYRRNTWYGMLNYVFEGAPFYAVSVFLPIILKDSGFAGSAASLAKGNLFLQMSGLLGILMMFLWVDRKGRKFMNYLGYGGVVLALLLYESAFPPSLPLLMGIFVLIQVSVWAGPASTDNLLLGELWPTRVRGTGAGIAAAAGRLSAIAGTLGLPLLIAVYGISGALWLPLVFSALGIVNTLVLGVETSGKTLEQMWGH